MGIGDWIKRRVQNWTTKPFPEGIPPALSQTSARAATVSRETTTLPLGSRETEEGPPLTEQAPRETPEEIAEKIMILIPYIKQYRSQGMLDDEIEAFLREHGWPSFIVKKAIQKA